MNNSENRHRNEILTLAADVMGMYFTDETSLRDICRYIEKKIGNASSFEKSVGFGAGDIAEGLPNYRRSDVAKNSDPKGTAWVTFRNGVYDVTKFIETHPGGVTKITSALGKDLARFWFLFRQHHSPQTLSLLETMRIGNVHPDDRFSDKDINDQDPYNTDPHGIEQGRGDKMIINSVKPYNAEPQPSRLLENYITPTDMHFIRNHLPVPVVDPALYRLTVTTKNVNFALSLADLKNLFPKVEVMSALQCAGNRVRGAHFADNKTLIVGTFFGAAMGNSIWGGVRLRDILRVAGVSTDDDNDDDDDDNDDDNNYVNFEALDLDESDIPFAGCVDIDKAMDIKGDVILAYEMNGKELSRDHGYPLRLICPGWLGIRNVKWLQSIIVSKEPTTIYWHANDKINLGTTIEQGPVQSLIIQPRNNQKLPDCDRDTVTVKGYAWSGGGRAIASVDVSIDGGATWKQAELTKPPGQNKWHTWAWTHWETKIDFPPNYPENNVEIVARAADVSFNIQPRNSKSSWVDIGVINNRWHRVRCQRPGPEHNRTSIRK